MFWLALKLATLVFVKMMYTAPNVSASCQVYLCGFEP